MQTMQLRKEKLSPFIVKTVLSGLVVILGLFIAPLSSYADGQFYFLAKYGPLGSTSQTGQGQYAVYLRWGAIEAELPNDVVRIELHRDDLNVPLLSFAPDSLKTSSEITNDIYGAPDQSQRLLATLTHLKERALSLGNDFTSDAFADELRARASFAISDHGDQRLWLELAARSDFNLAQAVNLAYMDVTASGTRTYELLAFNASGASRRLGQTTVTATFAERGNAKVFAAVNFSQVTEQSCNPLDRASDHHALALSWQPPGQSLTERLANEIALSGYDLYRSAGPVAAITEELRDLDISELARSAVHDARGEPVLSGLVKVNSSLITNRGNRDNAREIQWQQTRDALISEGVIAGQQYVYYLVAKDFAGHYGPTRSLLVGIPDRKRPKPPWSIYTFNDATNRSSLLVWDSVNVDNYLDYYGGENSDRQFCNLDSAQPDLALSYVKREESCITDPQVSDYLNVTDYRVYRFDSFEEASTFQDYDGDGYADANEAPSDRCRVNAQDSGDQNRLVASGNDLIVDPATARFSDSNVEAGQSYWYRVASVSPSGMVSELTPPRKINFVDREPPASPDVTVTRNCDKIKNKDQEFCERPVEEGDIGRFYRVQVSSEPGSCSAIYLEVDGELARVASSCGSDDPSNLTYDHDFGSMCGFAMAMDADGNLSAASRLPCVTAQGNDRERPQAPQLRSFDVEGVDGESVSATIWRLPLTPVSAINLELSLNDIVWRSETISVAGQEPTSISLPYQIPVQALTSSSDQWCVRLQSVGVRVEDELPQVSEWTPKRCQVRRALASASTENLPWPAEQHIVFAKTNLAVHSGAEFIDQGRGSFEQYFLFVDLESISTPTNCRFQDSPLSSGAVPPLFARVSCYALDSSLINPFIFPQFDPVIAQHLPLLVYRQATSPSGTKGPWVQVTPLLESLHWGDAKSATGENIGVLSDPYFGVYRPDTSGEDWRLVFIDRYPHLQGYRYQYQFVSMDQYGAIASVSQSSQISESVQAQGALP